MGLLLLLSVTACQKDDAQETAPVGIDPKYAAYHKFKTFHERAEGLPVSNPAITTRSYLDDEEVLDYIEGTLNLVYADASLDWETYDRKTDTFTIAMSSGLVAEVDVEDFYLEVRDSISAFYHSIAEEDKFPKLFDVEIVYSSLTQLDLSVMAMVGKYGKNLTPFGEYDYWDIFQNMATCDPYDTGPNASDVMTEAIDAYYKPYYCHFYTDQAEISSLSPSPFPAIDGWGDDNPYETAGDWVMDFRTFKTICDYTTSECLDFVNNGVYCLAPEEMNFYFSSIISIYDDYSEEIELEHMLTDIELREQTIGDEYHKSWECNDFWGSLHHCDVGNDFPHLLPFCCN